MQIRRQRPRTAANGFEKQDEASEAFKDIIIKYNIINDMTRHKLSGAGAAIPTPFTPDGRVDYPALARTIDYIIDGGVDFIVALGTTAETPTLYLHERAVVAMFIKNHIAWRVPLVIGVGGNSTSEVLDQLREFDLRGADAILSVTPYYNKATQRGLVRHFTAVADAVDRPLIVYNVPSRTGVSCTAETYAALAQHPNIVGVKEASGSFALIQETLNLCGDSFSIWSGNDEDTAAVCALGGAGVISVAANIVPREMHRLVELCLADRILEAGREQLRLAPLIRALFCEVNPIPVKTAMARMGLCSDLLRLPLCEMSEENRARLFAAMDACGIDA